QQGVERRTFRRRVASKLCVKSARETKPRLARVVGGRVDRRRLVPVFLQYGKHCLRGLARLVGGDAFRLAMGNTPKRRHARKKTGVLFAPLDHNAISERIHHCSSSRSFASMTSSTCRSLYGFALPPAGR